MEISTEEYEQLKRKASMWDSSIIERDATVVGLISMGFKTKEIASQLKKSPRTIEAYIATLLWRHKAKSQAHLVAIFLRSELIL